MEEGLQGTQLLVNINSKKKKEGNPCICPIFTEVIEDKSDKNEGSDTIFCEG